MKINPVFKLSLLSLVIGISCGNPAKQQSTTRGNARIGVDETFRLLVDTEIFTFQAHYPNAKIEPFYAPEAELIKQLRNDSLRLLVIGRNLTKEEIEFFASKKSHPKITKVAYDGVAFILNPASTDTNLAYGVLQDIFSGKIKTWQELRAQKGKDSIQVVFDHPQSGNARFVLEAFGLKNFPKNCFAVHSNEEVVNYVANHPHAMGIIGSNWISDPEDTVSHNFLKKIKVAGISSRNDPTAALGYFQPYQGYIASGEYPFKREINIISRELGVRVGTGFAAFMAGDIGQRIVLKSGLVPATAPIRLVNINNE